MKRWMSGRETTHKKAYAECRKVAPPMLGAAQKTKGVSSRFRAPLSGAGDFSSQNATQSKPSGLALRGVLQEPPTA